MHFRNGEIGRTRNTGVATREKGQWMSSDGNNVLILEDEVIIALDLAASLAEAGYSVQGPFHDAESTFAELDAGRYPQWAIRDINLGKQETSERVAQKLTEKNVPILFLTGYDANGSKLLQQFPKAEMMPKPMVFRNIRNWLDEHPAK